MAELAVCDQCARIVRLTNLGVTQKHDTVGVVIRARTGKKRRRCKGSGRLPRRSQP
jgi:hypothetical protein